jgi:hypothetical protein
MTTEAFRTNGIDRIRAANHGARMGERAARSRSGVAALVFLVCAWVADAAPDVNLWKAGAARIKITPDRNLWLSGFASRTTPSRGVRDDLFAKALALEDAAGSRLVIITYDLIGIPRTLRKSLARQCGEKLNLDSHALLLNASHTHSGPELRLHGVNGDDGDVKDEAASEAYGRELEQKSFQLISEALRALAPAKVDYVHARAGFAMNRRRPTEKGIINAPFSDGPVEHDVPVLRVTSQEGGRIRALVFGYACHPTTLSLPEYSADYAGSAQTYLEESYPDAVALFVQGCGGDQNPYPRAKPDYAAHHGRALANAVETALGTVAQPLTGPLRVAFEEVELAYAPLPPREEIEQRLQSKARFWPGHAKWLLERIEQGTVPKSYPCPVQVVRIGRDFVLVAIGGEAVVDYAARLKPELAEKAVWVAGYSNDVFGYIPSRRMLAEGGYEARDAMAFSRTHPGPWDSSLEDRIIAKVHELNRRLRDAAPR